MTDIVITATSVVAGSNAKKITGVAGETITAGQAVYQDTTTKQYKKADNNGASATIRTPIGIALNGAAVDQPLFIQTSGDITIGATLTAGLAYYLSDTPGGICPVADIGSGEYVCLIGVSTSTTNLSLGIKYTGVAL